MPVRISLLALLVPVLLVSACKKKHRQADFTSLAVADTVKQGERVRPVALPAALSAKLTPTYTRCQGKLRATYQDENRSLPFTLNFKTERGSITTFYVTAALGITVATGWIRPDSVYVDSRLGGTTIKEPLSRITEFTGLPPDLSVLESVLTGRYALPRGFVPVAATDTSLQALPLPNEGWVLRGLFSPANAWPTEMLLSDDKGQYAIRNYAQSNVPEPGRTLLVQTDSNGKVVTSVKLDAATRKFE